MEELLNVLASLGSEAKAMDKLSALAVALLVAKYSVDILRAEIVQRGLAGLESAFKWRPGVLQWSAWTDRVRVLVTMGQSFLVGLLSGLLAGMSWGAAAGAGFFAAVGAKGLHDSGVLPGRRPSARGPAAVIDRVPRRSSDAVRELSLRTSIETGKVEPRKGPEDV